MQTTVTEITRRARLPALMALCAVFVLGACAQPEPVVTKSVSYDAKGRMVTHYHICETRGVPLMEETACRTETVTHNYCYQTLARVDCYDRPIPGRTAMKFRP